MSIKRLIKKMGFTGITLNIGFIGLNFAGGLAKVNIVKALLFDIYSKAFLSSACLSEELCLVFGSLNHEIVSFISAFI